MLVAGIVLVRKISLKHKKIDTESIAIVKEVIDLGRDMGSKVCAVKYEIQSSEPFEIVVTPCKKVPCRGADRSIFYEKADPKNNYYFKTIGQLDSRFLLPIGFISIGTITMLILLINMIVK